ncbi:gliding motility-associated C-terminal domain-containing protein [Cellulophaga sp. HaHaR_3_176]|uniref:gliding motility-associated C-terminal domain-containing protein n=1 Tax=Cellulophaga sp. HaHaR_3_176 TaxID=1942464 RepID=UPI001C1F8B3A|nr:gliding motility-associated C-terminal domain-containing protein [Cellulophaga sp. HaHaR_3_176]QWX84292.1 gliding motility-associated C-terminal domain-containing protein [Cellulophaga sp. HaHaR_3_176]
MKNYIYIVSLLVGVWANAQTALHHAGNMQIHDNASIGFHTNFINNAPFDQNLGLAGFYGNGFLSVQGSTTPVFYDFEINARYGVILNTSVSVENATNFVFGDIITDKSLEDIYFAQLADAFYIGESETSKVDGYALVTDQQVYSFPIGDEFQLRPLILNSESINLIAKCAYFFENPNTPESFTTSFSTEQTDRQLDLVNTKEFWRLEGSVPSTITISWNAQSDIAALTEKIENLLVVGWNKQTSVWDILGNTAVSGDALTAGIITSDTFTPDDYEILTIGSLLVPQDRMLIDNFYLSPNGDGINDALVIEELELSPNNNLKLYDRNGLLVFQQENYTNEFVGISNTDNFVLNQESGLPAGVYFYIVKLFDLGFEFQGFLYLSQP